MGCKNIKAYPRFGQDVKIGCGWGIFAPHVPSVKFEIAVFLDMCCQPSILQNIDHHIGKG